MFSFQTRLMVTYSLLIFIVVAAIGVGFYRYSTKVFEDNAATSLALIADKSVQQLDNLIRPMDFITTYLLSSGDFMSSMATLAFVDRTQAANKEFVNQAIQTIKENLLTYAITKNFASVSIFNPAGDFLSSDFINHLAVGDARPVLAALSWLAGVEGQKGRLVVLPDYRDPWMGGEGRRVFGVARAIRGAKGFMGYVEVQNNLDQLERVFQVPDPAHTHVLVLTRDSQVFFGNGPLSLARQDFYADLAAQQLATGEDGAAGGVGNLPASRLIWNPVTRAEEIFTASLSAYTGIRVILVQERSALVGPIDFLRTVTILIAAAIIALSLLYTWISARQLSRPIRQLRGQMEATGLDNLLHHQPVDSSNDEIMALSSAFSQLRSRLNEAVSHELSAQSLQMQANLDSLQAQINPHFLFNILTVLAGKGLETGNQSIVEICDGIAGMLRYSTATTKRSATIADELQQVRTYLGLMKQRFEHRLEYAIDVPPGILAEPIPKIVLQQLVENSFAHGFHTIHTIMRISIRGRIAEGWWFLDLADNGQGFDPATLSALEASLAEFRRNLAGAIRPGFAIGGMGLVNTYARLALFYRDDFVFHLGNATEGEGLEGSLRPLGALVTIGAPLGAKPAGAVPVKPGSVRLEDGNGTA